MCYWINRSKGIAQNGLKFPNLYELSLFENQITDEGVAEFGSNSNKFSKIHSINLGNNKLTDKGIILFTQRTIGFPSLRIINLENNSWIISEGLSSLALYGYKFP